MRQQDAFSCAFVKDFAILQIKRCGIVYDIEIGKNKQPKIWRDYIDDLFERNKSDRSEMIR